MGIVEKIKSGVTARLKKSLNSVFEISEQAKSLSDDRIEALSRKDTISGFLFYRYAEEYLCNDNRKRTVYTMDDGRRGFILQIHPPRFLNDDNEWEIHNFLNSIMTDNAIIYINTFASRNIEKYINDYQGIHSLDGVMVRNRAMLKELVSTRADSMRDWIKEPMGRNGIRLRKFTNTVAVLLPKGTDIDTVIDECITSENSLLNYNPVDMKPEELIPLVSEFINPVTLKEDDFHDNLQEISTQISKGARAKLSKENGNIEFGENWYATSLTTEKFPKEISAFEFQSAFFDPFGKDFKIAIPGPFMCSLVINYEDIKKVSKKIISDAQWNIGQINSVPDTMEKKKPILKDKREEYTNIIYYIEKLSEFPLKATWNLTLYERNEKALKNSCEMIKKKFREISSNEGGQWLLKEESYSSTTFFGILMSLPLQDSKIIRKYLNRDTMLFKSNNAAIAPIITGGQTSDKPTMSFVDRTGAMHTLDIFSGKKNYNGVIIGPPGSGKSFLMNEISVSHLTSGLLIRLIDIGDSYKDITLNAGGRFVEVTEETPLCLNFFSKIATLIDNEEDEEKIVVHPDELTTIIPIIGNMMKMDLKSSHSESSLASEDRERKAIVSILEEAIQVSYDRQGSSAGMQAVWEYLCELRDKFGAEDGRENLANLVNTMTVALHDYVVRKSNDGRVLKGRNYGLFNGVNNLDFDNDLFTFELEKLTKKGDDVVEIVSMAVLHQMANEAYFVKEKYKLIGLDETAKLLRKKLFVSYIDDFSRRIRKYGGALILISQYISDFFHNKEAATIFEGASFKFLLEQEEESIDDAIDSGKLSFNEGKRQLLKSVKAKSPDYNEFLLVKDSSVTVLLNKVDVFSYWLFTTKPSDKHKIQESEKNYNLRPGEGAWFMALVTNGKSEKEALNEIEEKRRASF